MPARPAGPLDALAGAVGADIAAGLQLDTTGHREAGGKLFFQTQPLNYTLPSSLPQGKADNQILGVVEALRQQQPRARWCWCPRTSTCASRRAHWAWPPRTTRTTRRWKTATCCMPALALPPDFWAKHGKTVESWQQGAHTFYRVSGPIVPSLLINQFVYFEAPGEPSLYARVTEIRGKTAVFQDAQGLQSPEERRVGCDHPQPRTELRDEPADGPGG
jgi:PhoH-like ATPase